jgi:tRNA(Ile)-lysidine synthase
MKEMELEEKVLQFIRDNGMLEPGDDVTAALSGGADSVALLWVLRKLAPELGFSLRAAHFHHGIRGAEADRDAEFCRDLCARWSVPFSLGRGDAPARAERTGESLEEAARALRYDFLRRTAPGKLATAHNADDNAETVLMHLLRGTGLRGLGGIPPRREELVRPLLCCTRAELEALLEREGLPHVEDSSNAEDDCLRNRLRHRVLPLLRAENPNLTGTLGRTAALLRAEDACLSRLAAQADEECRTGDSRSCQRLLALDPVLRRRVLLGALWDLGLENPSQVYVDALEGLLTAGPSARLDLPGGLQARREYDRLYLGPPQTPPKLPDTALRIPGETVLPEGLGSLHCFVTKNSYFSKKNLTTFAIKCDMMTGHELRVRGRAPGDRLTLSGGAKRLKELMIDKKLPAQLRGAVPILTLDGQPVAAFGVGADPAIAPGPGEEALLVSYRGPLFPEP